MLEPSIFQKELLICSITWQNRLSSPGCPRSSPSYYTYAGSNPQPSSFLSSDSSFPPSHPTQAATTQQPASTPPGQLATSLQGQAVSLPPTAQVQTPSHPTPAVPTTQTAPPLPGPLLPPTSPAHVPMPMPTQAAAAGQTPPLPQSLLVPPPPPPNLEMSIQTSLGAISKQITFPPLAKSELSAPSQSNI